ncbi:MAG: hypothetical protein H6Q11_1413, partial [Acidobacteria bacterium]|nr:hypothetical protein [Acidobacteriota bacterium]
MAEWVEGSCPEAGGWVAWAPVEAGAVPDSSADGTPTARVNPSRSPAEQTAFTALEIDRI